MRKHKQIDEQIFKGCECTFLWIWIFSCDRKIISISLSLGALSNGKYYRDENWENVVKTTC